MGDLGIFIPLALSLIALNGLNPFSVFFMGGLLYLLAGYWFGHPLPVQPLKALAATALATGAGTETISAAAIIMGGALFLFTWLFRENIYQAHYTGHSVWPWVAAHARKYKQH